MSSSIGEPGVPFVTSDQMREVDRLAVEDYRILLIQMMENAGRNLARLARRRFLGGNPRGREVLVLAGKGGNGGGGLVCARRLHNWGANLHVTTTTPLAEFRGVPENQLGILQRMGVPITLSGSRSRPDRRRNSRCSDRLQSARSTDRSGCESYPRGQRLRRTHPGPGHPKRGGCNHTGSVHEPTIRAAATLTLALPKQGLRSHEARDFVGELYLADIGLPLALYARSPLGLTVGPIFAQDEIIRLF